MRPELATMTSRDIRAGALSTLCPDLYRLKDTVENSPAHRKQNVFDHTLAVLDGLDRILAPGNLPDPIHAFVMKYLARCPTKPPGYTRATLLKMAIWFHDMAKFDTLIPAGSDRTQCPGHEAFSVLYIRKYEAVFELEPLEADMIRHMVGQHGLAYTVVALVKDRGQPDFYLPILEAGLRVELLLLTYADMLGNHAPAWQKTKRIEVIVDLLRLLMNRSTTF